MAPVIARGDGRARAGRRRQLVRRVRHGAAVGDARARLRPGRRGGGGGRADGGELQPAVGVGAAGRRGVPRAGARRRHGQVRQERLRRDDGGGQAGPRRDRPRRWSRSAGRSPFFSTDDWFIGTTEMDAGIPGAQRELTVGFDYNDLGSVERAAGSAPRPDRLRGPRGRHGAWPSPDAGLPRGPAGARRPRRVRPRLRRDHHGHALVARAGPRRVYGVTPDLSTWGKALGNGFAVSALAGRRELMELGGLRTDAARAFLLSTTHGAGDHRAGGLPRRGRGLPAARRRGRDGASRDAGSPTGRTRPRPRSASPTTSPSSAGPPAWCS